MNLEVFRELDTVWIRDADTDDEWPLPAEVWDGIHQKVIDHVAKIIEWADPNKHPQQEYVIAKFSGQKILTLLGLPPVWGRVSVEPTGASAGDNPDGRG